MMKQTKCIIVFVINARLSEKPPGQRAKKINVLEEAKWLLGCAWMPDTTP